MLVGHNPGLGSLVRKMSDGHEKRRCRRAYEHFPTGAAAVLELDLDNWAEIDFAKARFVDFAAPRELMEACRRVCRQARPVPIATIRTAPTISG